MNIEDAKKMNTTTLSVVDAASIIGCSPNKLRLQARKDASKLGFPVVIIEKRIKIPRVPFINFFEGTAESKTQDNA